MEYMVALDFSKHRASEVTVSCFNQTPPPSCRTSVLSLK